MPFFLDQFSQSFMDNSRGKKNLVLSSWGDDVLLLDDNLNPYYNPRSYEKYSEQTRKNIVGCHGHTLDSLDNLKVY